jgi:hypothetical protein
MPDVAYAVLGLLLGFVLSRADEWLSSRRRCTVCASCPICADEWRGGAPLVTTEPWSPDDEPPP